MNLIKLLYVIFCGAINIVVHGILESVDQNVARLTQAIRDEDFNIVTLTRPIGNNSPLLPWEVLDLFSDINKLFGGSFDTKLHENIASNVMQQIFYRDSTCVDAAKLSGYYKIMQQKMPNSAVNKKSNVNGDVESILLNNKPVILVFQEYFFSKTHALNNEYVNMIIEFCCKLSKSVTGSVIIVNFLHEFASPSLSYLDGYDTYKNDLLPLYIHDMWSLGKNGKMPASDHRLSNYSLVFYKGIPIALYRKGFYACENDWLVNHGYTYEFGNFKTKKLVNVERQDAERISKIIEDLEKAQKGKVEDMSKLIDKLQSLRGKEDCYINEALGFLKTHHNSKIPQAIKCLHSLINEYECSCVYDALFSGGSPLLRLFICADLNLPATVLFDIVKSGGNTFRSALYVIQSNYFCLSDGQMGRETWNCINHLLQRNAIVVQADPCIGPFVGRATGGMKMTPFQPLAVRFRNDHHGTQALTDVRRCCFYGATKEHTGYSSREFELTGNEYIINVWDLHRKSFIKRLFGEI